MKELAKQFIGEECIIYTIASNDGSIQGVIKEIDDGGMVIERSYGGREIVNLDFVTRIRQYPRKKNRKKKDIVWDEIDVMAVSMGGDDMVLCDARWSDAKDCSYGDCKNYTDVLGVFS